MVRKRGLRRLDAQLRGEHSPWRKGFDGNNSDPFLIESFLFTPRVNRRSKMSAGECQTKNRGEYDKDDDKPIVALDEGAGGFCFSLSYFR